MFRKKIIPFVISLLILMVLSMNVRAQEFLVDLDFNVGAPQGEFSDEIDRLGWGLGLMGGYKIPETPLMVGLDFGFMNFGVDTRTEPLSTTIPDLTVEVENSYNLVTGNLLALIIFLLRRCSGKEAHFQMRMCFVTRILKILLLAMVLEPGLT